LLGLVFLALVPNYPGFYVLGFLFALLCLAVYAPGNLKDDLRRPRPAGAGRLRDALCAAVIFAIVLAAGAVTFLPVMNISAPKEIELGKGTLALLGKVGSEVVMRAYVGDQDRLPQVRHLLSLYSRAQPLIKADAELSFGKGEAGAEGLRVATQDTVLISSGPFREQVSPISQGAIDAGIARLVSPPRLVHNLQGEGEKSASDGSPRGLSLWNGYLEARKVYVEDRLWDPSERLPAGSAVILAGPRMPLDPEKELALRNYLANGGKLMMLLDPLVAAVDPSFFAGFGLGIPEGLASDPDSSLAGTESSFLVLKNFPAHPVTVGLTRPVLMPLAGAISDKPAPSTPRGPTRSLTLGPDDDTQGGPSSGEGPGAEAGNEAAGGDAATGAALQGESPQDLPPLQGHTWVIAMSGNDSFLETDLSSIREGTLAAGPTDIRGPLALATATSFTGGGRLVLVADSDLASNAYIGYAGNLDFLSGALYWLMGAEEELAAPQSGYVLSVTTQVARLLFFVPVIIWPLLVLAVWGIHYRRRKMASA
jgi:hypothetical protein